MMIKQPALAPSPQPRPAPTVRALPAELAVQRGPFWMPIRGPNPTPIDTQHFERRARLISAIARGREWLDDVVSGRVTAVAELCAREKCSVRQANMTISLAFLAPNLIKAAVEGRLPRGIGIERLRDLPTEWNRQFETLGLRPD